jgi:hypothetical protein
MGGPATDKDYSPLTAQGFPILRSWSKYPWRLHIRNPEILASNVHGIRRLLCGPTSPRVRPPLTLWIASLGGVRQPPETDVDRAARYPSRTD